MSYEQGQQLIAQMYTQERQTNAVGSLLGQGVTWLQIVAILLVCVIFLVAIMRRI